MQISNDHDLLITLNANVNTFLMQYQIDIKELKDGTSRQITDHEIRLNKLENIVTEVKPIESKKEFKKLQKQFNDFIVQAKTARYFVGVITALLSSTLALVGNYLLSLFGIIN